MQWVRQMALGICLLCAAAGMIRIFWPDNHFKPVINTVLMLYILTSVLQSNVKADWNAIAGEITRYDPSSASSTDLTEYQEQLGLEVSVQALQELFRRRNIEAEFLWEGETLHVILKQEADVPRAQELMAENAGALSFTIETEGGK
nr:hypothetical protein [uncultured Gemmiger sp.]